MSMSLQDFLQRDAADLLSLYRCAASFSLKHQRLTTSKIVVVKICGLLSSSSGFLAPNNTNQHRRGGGELPKTRR